MTHKHETYFNNDTFFGPISLSFGGVLGAAEQHLGAEIRRLQTLSSFSPTFFPIDGQHRSLANGLRSTRNCR